MGRPEKDKPKLNPDLIKKIGLYLEAGNFAETAAAACGISRDSYYAWLRKGANETSGPHFDFNEAVTNSMARGEVRLLETVRNASHKEWQAAAWMLERRHPKKWGKKKQIELIADELKNAGVTIVMSAPPKAKKSKK